MPLINIVFMVFAAVCFMLAACEVQVPRVNLVALGLAAWVLSAILR